MDNKYYVAGNTAHIQVGKYTATIDAADLKTVAAIPGRINAYPYKGTVYARFNKAGGQVMLHRLLMQPGPGQNTIHMNGNGLDCTRSNLLNIPLGADKATAIAEELKRRFVEKHPKVKELEKQTVHQAEKRAARMLENGKLDVVDGKLAGSGKTGHDRPRTDIDPVRGVSWHRATGRWFASGYHEGKRFIVGYYAADKLATANADMEAFRQHGPSVIQKKGAANG